MSYKTRLYTPQDYELYAAWSAAWGWGQIAKEALPTSGRIVMHDNTPICMGFLYTTNSAMAWVDWIMSNPASAKLERDQALDIMIEALLDDAKRSGASYVFTATSLPALEKRLKKHGYIEGDKNINHFIKPLNKERR